MMKYVVDENLKEMPKILKFSFLITPADKYCYILENILWNMDLFLVESKKFLKLGD